MAMVLKKKETPPKRKKENLSIPFKPNSQIKIYFHKRRKKKT
jgi:hypothetical protein